MSSENFIISDLVSDEALCCKYCNSFRFILLSNGLIECDNCTKQDWKVWCDTLPVEMSDEIESTQNPMIKELDTGQIREFKINITACPTQHINNLIIALVHCGHDVYMSADKNYVCFTGFPDDVMF